MLQAGVHYVHVHVKRRRAGGPRDVCNALQAALTKLEETPGRARCIAERGQQLARSLSMEQVYGYFAGVLRKASAAQRPEELGRRSLFGPEPEKRVVTKRNLLRHVSASTRPWIEHVFLPAVIGGNASLNAVGKRAGSAAFTFS